MSTNKTTFFYFVSFFAASIITETNSADFVQEYNTIITSNIDNVEKLAQIYPKTVQEIQDRTATALIIFEQEINEILSTTIPTFQNTVHALNLSSQKLNTLQSLISLLTYVHPDQDIRDTAQESLQQIQNKYIELTRNPKLYDLIQNYVNNYQASETLTSEDTLLLDSYLAFCKQAGFHLPSEQLEQVKQLTKEIAEFEQQFILNINNDDTKVSATLQDLDGLSPDFIAQLENTDDTYYLTTDYPTYATVMRDCHVASTRKNMLIAAHNKAYPKNHELLLELLQKRHQLAQLIGYSDFTAMDLTQTAAQNIATVEKFLIDLADKAQNKLRKEISELTADLPDNITINVDGSLNTWDYSYILNVYKKKNFSIDENFIAEHLPIEKVIDTTFEIYQKFLGLTFKQVTPAWSWHEDVYLIAIYRESSNELLGYLFLDLFPRQNKYTHACVAEQIPSYIIDGVQNTAAAAMITNFPKPTKETPSLLKHIDVVTFFHEFGHAMHCMLGRTKHAAHAGFNVAADFTEVPSQMFEQWMYQPEILANMSTHYQTKQPLNIDIINNKLNMRKATSGYQILRQCVFALFALQLMTNSEIAQNPSVLWNQLHTTYFQDLIAFAPDTYGYAAFGHLANQLYMSKYYVYLWTEVIAMDLFNEIKNNQYNDEYRQKAIDLLSAGGSIPSHDLLLAFLQREPNQQAFMAILGLQ